MRVVLEELGVAYVDVGRERGYPAVVKVLRDSLGGFPTSAPPAIKRGSFVLCQTPTICETLGRLYGALPETLEEQAHASQLNLCVADFISEGRAAFHPLGDGTATTPARQKAAVDASVARFCGEGGRLWKWLTLLERALERNDGGSGFFFGSKLTYIDLVVFHALRATESQFPVAWKAAAERTPLIVAFKERMAERPRLAAYLKSDRALPFAGDSMM